jgi:hypothetical protein
LSLSSASPGLKSVRQGFFFKLDSAATLHVRLPLSALLCAGQNIKFCSPAEIPLSRYRPFNPSVTVKLFIEAKRVTAVVMESQKRFVTDACLITQNALFTVSSVTVAAMLRFSGRLRFSLYAQASALQQVRRYLLTLQSLTLVLEITGVTPYFKPLLRSLAAPSKTIYRNPMSAD